MLRCSRCGCTQMSLTHSGPHTGAYCSECGFFVKWLTKEEARVISFRSAERDRYISETALLRKLKQWNMGKEIPTWVVNAVKDTPSIKGGWKE